MFLFCKPVSSKKRFSPFRKLNDDFSFTLFENVKSVNWVEWKLVTGGKTIFLEPEYLKAIESCSGSIMNTRFVIVYSNSEPCGIIYFQVVDFKAEMLAGIITGQTENLKSTSLKLFQNYIGSNKDEILMRLITCGNNLMSGEYGFSFSEHIGKEAAHELVLKITEIISKEEKFRGAISAILIKDFTNKLVPAGSFKKDNYTDFLVEPNMIVEIPSTVKSLDEYTQLFAKKYRNRAKSILRSCEGLEKKIFTLEEIRELEKHIYQLYENVYDRARFKLLKLPDDYFSEVKKSFDKSFFIYGYFRDKQLIAFSSYFLKDDCLEAHYIGFDYELNNEYDLYQNILYCNIRAAIENGKTKVNLGRTAAEIKSTVGAKAVNLICYTKPQNTISKLVMKPLISLLQPSEWTPRHPFKEEG